MLRGMLGSVRRGGVLVWGDGIYPTQCGCCGLRRLVFWWSDGLRKH